MTAKEEGSRRAIEIWNVSGDRMGKTINSGVLSRIVDVQGHISS
jgi:hypothetical protein